MKNHLFLSVAVLLCSLAAMADPITPSQAKALAASYMKTSVSPQLVCRKVASTNPEENQPLYIFSRGVGQGFVMISGDDALPTLLGITDHGDFDENNLPPALQDMIDYYSEAAKQLQANPELSNSYKANRVLRKASGTKDIAALLTSHHHQSWPYNNLCPYITGTTNRAATGCVATAASQIVYYWRKDLDDRTKYNTPTYGYGDAPVTESIPKGTPLKWNLMQDSYSGNDPQECTDAIATLVSVVGTSAWLTYGSSTSGQIDNCRNVFSGQFGLNGGTTVWKSSYSQSSWEKMIIQDLEASQPVLYSGVHPSNGGHAVVIDGYKLSTNTFHFNFGWGSGNGYDGYYTVDDVSGMNGFYESQGMVHNIYPSKPNISGKITSGGEYFVSRVANTITAKISNNGTLPQKGFYLYCLSGTNTPASSSSPQDKDEEVEIQPGMTSSLTFSFSPSSTNNYTIYLCDANKNILDKVSGVESRASVADLILNGISVDGGTSKEINGHKVWQVANSTKANVTVSFTNGAGGTLCSPSVKATILKDDGTGNFVEYATKTKKTTIYHVGETQDMVFDMTGLTQGNTYCFSLPSTASTNKTYPINFNGKDTCIYFAVLGADMSVSKSEDGLSATVTGTYNPTVFATLSQDSTIALYDMTQVTGLYAPLESSNKNAMFYCDASQNVSGKNIVTDNVCSELDLTPGYNFQPKESFHALKATYHATQAVGKFGTAILPFDAETPSGLFARRINSIKTSYLNDVDSCNMQMLSGTPYMILSGKSIDIIASNVPVSITIPSTATDTLRGTWTNIIATDTQYVLDDEDLQYFNTATGGVIPALTAYLEYTKKVRSTSTTYNTKDKKAKTLAQEIATAIDTYQQYADVSTDAAKTLFMSIIEEANDTLRSQPVISYQSSQVNALKDAIDAYIEAASCTADNGYVDKTAYILNPSFELGSIKNWKSSGTTSIYRTTSSRSNYMSGADGTCFAYLSPDVSLQQTITDVPNGVYQLVACVAGDYDTHVTLFANDDTTTIQTTDFGPMYFIDETLDDIKVTDGTLTIGVQLQESGFCKVDNFRLYQISEETPVLPVFTGTSSIPLQGMYDLQGRRLSETPRQGVYILNGKKYVK